MINLKILFFVERSLWPVKQYPQAFPHHFLISKATVELLQSTVCFFLAACNCIFHILESQIFFFEKQNLSFSAFHIYWWHSEGWNSDIISPQLKKRLTLPQRMWNLHPPQNLVLRRSSSLYKKRKWDTISQW